MISIIRETYEERVQKYMKCGKGKTMSFLNVRDSYKGENHSSDYEKMTLKELAEYAAKRDLKDSPDTCKELEGEKPEMTIRIDSASTTSSVYSKLYNKD